MSDVTPLVALAEVIVWFYDHAHDGTFVPAAIREAEATWAFEVYGAVTARDVAEHVDRLVRRGTR